MDCRAADCGNSKAVSKESPMTVLLNVDGLWNTH